MTGARDEIQALFDLPFNDLLFRARHGAPPVL